MHRSSGRTSHLHRSSNNEVYGDIFFTTTSSTLKQSGLVFEKFRTAFYYVKDYFNSKRCFNDAVTRNSQIQLEDSSEHFIDKKFLLIKEMLSDMVVKSSRSSRPDCLQVSQSTPNISLVWGSTRVRSSGFITWSSSDLSCHPALRTSAQHTPHSASPCAPPRFSEQEKQNFLVFLAAHSIQPLYDENISLLSTPSC